MHPHATHTSHIHVLAHAGLQTHLDSPNAPLSTVRTILDRVDFVDDEDLTAPGDAIELPVLIPVTSEFQAEGLRAVRVRHPLSLLIAVTTDVSGYRTYYAIRSGANFVLNLAIPAESQIDMLYAQLRAHSMTATRCEPTEPAEQADPAAAGPAAPWLQAIRSHDEHQHQHQPEEPARPRTYQQASHPPALCEGDLELARMLCTSMTVSEIARRHYCSERSMYRRIRRLYDDLGVTGRAELMSMAAVLGARLSPRRQALTARAG
ncbi:DNA-binding response regulator [Streptomyces sp. NPDC045431]|uniref:helix-turn-helix transcriptional regulator n=1 Tax=Streptomyces sp. NPDC045431 TaxID=3155613 RepID=UPI0033C432D6